MIKEQAIVVNVSNNQVTVVSELTSSCQGCQQKQQCGSGQVADAFPTKKLSLTITSSQPLKVGDKVTIGLNENYLLSSAWQVYLLPLFGLIFAGFIGQSFFVNTLFLHEIYAVLLSVVGGYLGYALAKFLQISKQEHLAPKIMLKSDNDIVEIKSLD